jgi:CxxC-x17-CxxC domain-containing protein
MGFNNEPRQGGYSGNFNSSPREMHKAVCSECKKDCEVPFKPTPGKAVLCRECFAKKPKAPRRY